MNATFTPSLSRQQLADFDQEGYLIVRNVLSAGEAADLRRVVREQVQRGAYPPRLTYPEPAKYTVSGNRMAEPRLAAIAEHPVVVGAVESALGGPAHLTASVAYLRTPSDKGGGAHTDYKRWRPVGSSMNWVFAIIPLNDFDTSFGPFMVSPRSHKLPRVIDPTAHVLDLTAPDREQLPPFIDPELKAGDLLVVNGHVWHQAPAGTTSEDRCGIFNKYCAADAPPAAGYYPYNSAARDALSDAGKRLLPVCFDQPITTTRLLIERPYGIDSKYLLCRDPDSDVWRLPGGEGWEEESSGWDVGSRIGSLQALVKAQLGLDVPWMSYIEDQVEEDGVCRVYGFSDANVRARVRTSATRGWFTPGEMRFNHGDCHPICYALDAWERSDIVRGKGKACSQSKHQFE